MLFRTAGAEIVSFAFQPNRTGLSNAGFAKSRFPGFVCRGVKGDIQFRDWVLSGARIKTPERT